MNNPIGRMPNPMAVPPIPPMGVNPTAQNPSAMAMPVVTQPKVDMQMMGTSPEKRKKFNDLMESLSAPRQESEDLPNVQGLHYGGMAGGFGMPMMPPMMSPYMGMGGFGGMGGLGMFGSPFAYNATQPLNSGNPFGTSMNKPLDVFTTDMKPIPRILDVGMREDQQYRPAVIDPNSPEEIEKRNKLMDYLSSVGTFPMNDFQPFQGLQGYERGGNVNIPMGRRNLLPQDTPGTKREMMKRDYASQAFRNAMDMRKLDRMMGGFNPRTAEASTMGNTISNADMSGIMALIEILKKGLPSKQGFSSVINRVINKEDGGEVQYLKGGGPTDLSEKIAELIGGAITTPEEERFKSPPNMGMAERPKMYGAAIQEPPKMYGTAAPVNPYNKNIGYNVEQGLPKNDPLLTQGQNVKVGMKYEMNPLYQDRNIIDTSFMAGQKGKLDEMRAENRKPTYYDVMMGMTNNQGPPTLDAPILPMLSGPDIDPIIPKETTFKDDFPVSAYFNTNTSTQSPIDSFFFNLADDVKDLFSGIGSFANGGSVQYLKGGGPSVIKEKDFNKDTTIPDFFSNIGNMIKNLISPVNKAKSVDTGYGDLSDPKSAFPGSDLNFSEPPKIPTLEKIEKETKFPEQNVRLNMPRQNLIPPAVKIPDILYDDRLDFSTASGINDVAPPVSPLNIGQYDIVQGMTEADKAFPASYFVADLVPAPQYLQSQKSFMPITSAQMPQANVTDPLEPFGGAGQYPESILYGDRFDPADVQKDFFKTSASPDRPENISQIAENIAAQSGQSGQQGFGIGKLLPLIVGMFNPTAGMALGIMQAMGGQGEGQGQGIFGNLFGGGQKEADPNIGTEDQRNIIEKFLGLKAGTITPGEAPPIGDVSPNTVQETIEKIAEPTVPDPVLGEDGTYSCPLPYVYDPNTKVCVLMEAGLGGQGAMANQTKAPAGMQMGGPVDPNLNMAVDNFIQALA